MVDDHKHCIVCGRVVTPDKLFDSPECEERFRLQQRRVSRMRMYLFLMVGALFLLIILLSFARAV
jgi:predicted nucleic acid-binding Zn ribbon protein